MPHKDFALLLIDVQNDFWYADVAAAFPGFRDNVRRLLEVCRGEGIDVLHVRARFSADGSDWMARYRLHRDIPCIAGTKGEEILPEARELPGESVLYKQSFDGFRNAELERWLRARDKHYVLVAGLVTSVCVLQTGASAAQRGMLAAVVEDCCADEPEVHSAVLERYRNILERVKVDDIRASLPRWQQQLRELNESSPA